MTNQPAKSYTKLAIAVIVAGLVVGAGILGSSYLGTPKTVTDTSPSTTTVTTSNEVSQSNATSTVCSVAVPSPQGIYLRLVNDSGSPIPGFQVTIQYASQAYCNPNPGGVHLYTLVTATNSSGWILFQGWLYYFVFIYSGSIYNFTLPGDPMAWTVGTISLPSGTLTTEICGLGGGALNSSCSNSVTTVETAAAISTQAGSLTSTSTISSSESDGVETVTTTVTTTTTLLSETTSVECSSTATATVTYDQVGNFTATSTTTVTSTETSYVSTVTLSGCVATTTTTTITQTG